MPKSTKKINILIIGAGKAGELVAKSITADKDSVFNIVGFIDDDERKNALIICGKPLLGTIDELRSIIENNDVEELFITVPSERGLLTRRVVDLTSGFGLVYKTLPRQAEVLMQSYDENYLRYIRKVKAEDLLGGEISKADQAELTDYVKDQTILITGAAGSIGSELSRQLTAHDAKKIIFYDWWENGIFDLRNQLMELYPESNLVFIIGDIKDKVKLNQILKLHKPDMVFHAAAYKHVPLMEENTSEAIRNNILGTKIVGELSIQNNVKKFVLISTDKAVNPTNAMGATKRSAEKIIHILSKDQSYTVFCAVRFGNVINSNGSAIPTFIQQIQRGGPVSVTHPEVTRFFMTIPEAVHLVLKASEMGENDDLFVLDMGEAVKIIDLVRLLITLEGYSPENDIPIEIVGLRPGEKLYEEVLVKEEEIMKTSSKKVFRTKNHHDFDTERFLIEFSVILEMINRDALNSKKLREQLKRMVSSYESTNSS